MARDIAELVTIVGDMTPELHVNRHRFTQEPSRLESTRFEARLFLLYAWLTVSVSHLLNVRLLSEPALWRWVVEQERSQALA